MKIRALALAAAVSLAASGAALATDLFEVVTPAPAMADEEYDWSGFYAGVYVGIQTGVDIEIGKLIGFNVETNDFVLGAEGRLGYVITGGFEDWSLHGRVGVDINDGLLLFAIGGVGQQFYFGGPYDSYRWIVGGGVEAAISDNFSVRGQVELNRYFGGSGGWVEATVAAVYNFH